MVTYEDCLALAELSPETVERIAAREHLPQIVALELACCLAAAAPRPQPSRLIDGALVAPRIRTATAEVPPRAA